MKKDALKIVGGVLVIVAIVALGMIGKIVEGKLLSIGFFW